MKIKMVLAASLLTVMANSSFAVEPETAKEEQRGALGGALVGAAVGGPVGAGAGAILGGGVIGKWLGKRRVEREFRDDLVFQNEQLKSRAAALDQHVGELNQDIDILLAKSNEWRNRQLPIQFKTASSEIEGHYEPQLKDVAEVLARNPDTTVVVSGFADRRGDSAYNQSLSEERVAEVKAYLLSRGVGRNQVVTQAFGETKPVAEEGSPENHFFDRRVVMSFEVDMRLPLATR